MKKLTILLVLFMAVVSASAQTYVGGTLGLGVASVKPDGADASTTTTFQIAPELGYNFNDAWAVGVSVGYNLISSGADLNMITVLPYVRNTFAHSGIFNFFGEVALGYQHQSAEGSSADGFVAALRPGFSAELSDNCAFVVRTSLLEYQKFDGVSAIGFALNNGIELGVEFSF